MSRGGRRRQRGPTAARRRVAPARSGTSSRASAPRRTPRLQRGSSRPRRWSSGFSRLWNLKRRLINQDNRAAFGCPAAAQDDVSMPHADRAAIRQVDVHPKSARREKDDPAAVGFGGIDCLLNRRLIVRAAVTLGAVPGDAEDRSADIGNSVAAAVVAGEREVRQDRFGPVSPGLDKLPPGLRFFVADFSSQEWRVDRRGQGTRRQHNQQTLHIAVSSLARRTSIKLRPFSIIGRFA